MRAITKLSQKASNSLDSQGFQDQFRRLRLGGGFNQRIRFKATR